nr:amidohydrolase family protein [uncultured Blautia sp.]
MRKKYIDFHTHTFPDQIAAAAVSKLGGCFAIENHTDGTAEGLLNSMKDRNIALSVVLPVVTNPKSTVKMNDYAAISNEKLGERGYLSFAGMHPDFEDYKGELRRIKSLGFKGIKLHPAYQNCNMDDVRYLRIVEEAAALDLIVVYHAGIDGGLPIPVYATVEMARHVIDTIGAKKLVLAHMGGWEQWDQVEQELCGAPVYFDTAACIGVMEARKGIPGAKNRILMSKEQMTRMIKKHGADKVLFATDSPWTGQKESLELFKTMELAEQEKELVLWENACGLLNN